MGTAYIHGKLTWGALIKGLFICDEYKQGTKNYHAYVRMDWCSPKDVDIKRDGNMKRLNSV